MSEPGDKEVGPPSAGSLCDVCGRSVSLEIVDYQKRCPASWLSPGKRDESECFRLGYEREKIRADKLQAERDLAVEGWRGAEASEKAAEIRADAATKALLDYAERNATRAVLTELLRLYDWRFQIAEREKLAERNALSEDFHSETRRQLRQYGTEKKAAWEAARRALLGSVATDAQPPQSASGALAGSEELTTKEKNQELRGGDTPHPEDT